MRSKHYIMALVILAVALGIIVVRRGEAPVTSAPGGSVVPGMEDWKTYESEKLGLRFSYPQYYFLEAEEAENANRNYAHVTLMEDTEENRLVREGKAPGREGPTTITVSVFQNDLDKQSPADWVRGMSYSNFKLSNGGMLASTTIGGLDGVTYRWSGLYEANAIVLGNERYIYMLTVTYLTPEDRIVEDFGRILPTIKFY